MSKTFFDIAISLDGFMAGTNASPDNPLGDDGPLLHNWMFVQKAFWKHLGTEDGMEDGPDGMESAFEKAKQSAKGKDIRIQGGAETIRQFLYAGHIDEFCIHISPVFLGRGIRLFEHINKDVYNVEMSEVISSKLTTHLKYKLTRK